MHSCGPFGGRVSRSETETREALAGSFDVRHRDALDAVSDVVLIMDRQGALIDANRAAEYAYGYERAELLSLNIRGLRAPQALGDLDRQFTTASGGGVTFDTVHVRRDGSTFPVEVSSSPLDVGGAIGLISVVRDITARKEDEELHARLLAQVSEANARLDGALTLLSSAVGATDLRSLLESIVTALSQVMGTDAAIFVVTEGDSMQVRAESGAGDWAPIGTRIRHGEGFCGRVAEAGVPLYVADILSSSAALDAHKTAGVHSMFGVPVYVDDELFGVLECAWVDERPVDEAENAMVKLAAERIALAIGSARLLERSRRGERLNAALNDVNARLNESFELGPALDEVLEMACSALECDAALLGRAALGDWRVEHAFGVALPDDGLVFDQLVLGAMSSDAPLVFTCSGSPHEAWLSDRLGLAEAMIAPVPARQGVGGALLFGRTGGDRRFDEQSTDFVRRLAQSLALVARQRRTVRGRAPHRRDASGGTSSDAAIDSWSRVLAPVPFGDADDTCRRRLLRRLRDGAAAGSAYWWVTCPGKGLEAAVLTSIIKDTIRAYAHETPSPAAAIARANIALGEAAKLPDFASVFYAVIDGAAQRAHVLQRRASTGSRRRAELLGSAARGNVADHRCVSGSHLRGPHGPARAGRDRAALHRRRHRGARLLAETSSARRALLQSLRSACDGRHRATAVGRCSMRSWRSPKGG